jgi:hypothetical protein
MGVRESASFRAPASAIHMAQQSNVVNSHFCGAAFGGGRLLGWVRCCWREGEKISSKPKHADGYTRSKAGAASKQAFTGAHVGVELVRVGGLEPLEQPPVLWAD